MGTPETATVTINGSPPVNTFNPCVPYGNCYQAVPESGTVSVIVDGITFTTGYGGGTTANQIASNLAASMNYQYSPITATVNGATITIYASVNGSDTNYPLSVSETFNP